MLAPLPRFIKFKFFYKNSFILTKCFYCGRSNFSRQGILDNVYFRQSSNNLSTFRSKYSFTTLEKKLVDNKEKVLKSETLSLKDYNDETNAALTKSGLFFQIQSEDESKKTLFMKYENLTAYNSLKSVDEYKANVGSIISGDKVKFPYFELKKDDLLAPLSQSSDSSLRVNKFVSTIARMNVHQLVGLQQYLLTIIPYISEFTESKNLLMFTNLKKVYCEIDKIACAHLRESSESQLYQMLAIASLWFELQLDKVTNFNRMLIRRMLSQAELNRISFLHLMFLIQLNRSLDTHQTADLVKTVTKYLSASSAPTISDLSLIGMAFFKTQTRMPQSLLSQYMQQCSKCITTADHSLLSDTSLSYQSTAILKVLRYSLSSDAFDPISMRQMTRQLVDDILATPRFNDLLLHSPVGITHLTLMMNSAYLQNYKSLYRQMFDHMMASLDQFRIKDLERFLYCMANAQFKSPTWMLRSLELFVLRFDQSNIYTDSLVSIIYAMLMLDYRPNELLALCEKKDFIQKLLETSKYTRRDMLLLIDCVLRLDQKKPKSLLSVEQLQQILKDTTIQTTTKKTRFLDSISGLLSSHYPPGRFVFINLLSFMTHPIPVILSSRVAQQLGRDKSSKSHTTLSTPIPFDLDRQKLGLFKGCVAFVPLTQHDYIYGPKIRGFTALSNQLLERLGFELVLLETKHYHHLMMPEHMRDSTSKQYQDSINRLRTILPKCPA